MPDLPCPRCKGTGSRPRVITEEEWRGARVVKHVSVVNEECKRCGGAGVLDYDSMQVMAVRSNGMIVTADGKTRRGSSRARKRDR